MIERILKVIMGVMWAGLILGVWSATIPVLLRPAQWIVSVTGNAFAGLALLGVVLVILGSIPGLDRATRRPT